mmetsp:Transcript_4687/g.10641  ORF Transcript_4687/g.10641 Transcript_4687/m.10641 type:complete len:320 (-) Transcript_4687:442-1401(-)
MVSECAFLMIAASLSNRSSNSPTRPRHVSLRSSPVASSKHLSSKRRIATSGALTKVRSRNTPTCRSCICARAPPEVAPPALATAAALPFHRLEGWRLAQSSAFLSGAERPKLVSGEAMKTPSAAATAAFHKRTALGASSPSRSSLYSGKSPTPTMRKSTPFASACSAAARSSPWLHEAVRSEPQMPRILSALLRGSPSATAPLSACGVEVVRERANMSDEPERGVLLSWLRVVAPAAAFSGERATDGGARVGASGGGGGGGSAIAARCQWARRSAMYSVPSFPVEGWRQSLATSSNAKLGRLCCSPSPTAAYRERHDAS